MLYLLIKTSLVAIAHARPIPCLADEINKLTNDDLTKISAAPFKTNVLFTSFVYNTKLENSLREQKYIFLKNLSILITLSRTFGTRPIQLHIEFVWNNISSYIASNQFYFVSENGTLKHFFSKIGKYFHCGNIFHKVWISRYEFYHRVRMDR